MIQGSTHTYYFVACGSSTNQTEMSTIGRATERHSGYVFSPIRITGLSSQLQHCVLLLYQLVNPRTYEVLAQSHPNDRSEGVKLSLDVKHDALHMLDAIVFSFVVLEGSRIAPVCTESKRRGKGGRPFQANQYSHRRALSEWNGVERLGTLDADTGVRTRMTRGFSV